MKKNHKLPLSMVLSGGVLLMILLAALLAPLLPLRSHRRGDRAEVPAPSAQHLLGTDNFGRDTFTRLLYGGRVSLLVGFLSMLISIVFGTVYGIVSGSSGKLVDGFMMRIVDILMSVPSFLIIITLNIYMNAGIRTLVVTIGLFSWMGVARIVRAEVLSLRERDFILASEGLGARKSWVITRHFARNVFSPCWWPPPTASPPPS
ncbi:MAG: ABC transporter permease [Oscillospiraceae bacterium]